jgi:alpha-beta hydrolase superfamily lysophospholipase
MIPESIFVDVQGMRIQVSAWGDPSKPVLFLLHGMRDHSRSWDWIAQEFSADSHWLHHTSRKAFVRVIRSFLSTLPER